MRSRALFVLCVLGVLVAGLKTNSCPGPLIPLPGEYEIGGYRYQAALNLLTGEFHAVLWKNGKWVDADSIFITLKNGKIKPASVAPGTRMGVMTLADLIRFNVLFGTGTSPNGTEKAPADSTTYTMFADVNENGQYDTEVDFFLEFDTERSWIHMRNPYGGMIVETHRIELELSEPLIELPVGEPLAVRFDAFWDDPVTQESTHLTQHGLALDGRTVFLPHTPAGVFGNLAITTQIVLNNVQTIPVDAQIDTFNAGDGSPADTSIGGAPASQHLVTIPPESSRIIEFVPMGTPQFTWARLMSSQPIGVATNFQTREKPDSPQTVGSGSQGIIVAEAGIAATGLSAFNVLFVEINPADRVDTGFVIVNPTDTAAQLNLKVTRADTVMPAALATGSRPLENGDEVVALGQWTLDPGTQISQFVSSFFDLPEGELRGTLIIESNVEVAVSSLKTVNLLQSSSLPAGTLQ